MPSGPGRTHALHILSSSLAGLGPPLTTTTTVEPQPSPWELQWGPVRDLGGLGGQGPGRVRDQPPALGNVLGWAQQQAGWGIRQAWGQGPALPLAA